MATRSGEDHLIRRLESVHLHGGRPVFVKILADIRRSHIRWKYEELFFAVRDDAKGLRMTRDPDVRATLRHICRQRSMMRKKMRPVAANLSGHAIRC